MSKYRIKIEGKTYEMDVELINRSDTPVSVVASNVVSNSATVSSGSIVAPMPGTIIKILRNEGDEVKAGEVVLVLEAMKMENEITAPISGTIASVNCAVGGTVAGGTVLFEIK